MVQLLWCVKVHWGTRRGVMVSKAKAGKRQATRVSGCLWRTSQQWQQADEKLST